MSATRKKKAKEIEENYLEIYREFFDSFRKDKAKYVRQLREYRLAFLDFDMPNGPLTHEEDSDSEGNHLGDNEAGTSRVGPSPPTLEPPTISNPPHSLTPSQQPRRSRSRSQSRSPTTK